VNGVDNGLLAQWLPKHAGNRRMLAGLWASLPLAALGIRVASRAFAGRGNLEMVAPVPRRGKPRRVPNTARDR